VLVDTADIVREAMFRQLTNCLYIWNLSIDPIELMIACSVPDI